MTNVEQIHLGFQWAEPLQGTDLNVEFVGSDLQITGLFPTYGTQDSACDLIHQFEKTPEQIAKGQKTGTQSPEVRLANADTDDELIAFVQRFGPVVAKSVEDAAMIPDKDLGEPRSPRRIIARQDIEELRKEQIIYRAALALVMQLDHVTHDYVSVQQLMQAIDEKMTEELKQPKVQYDVGLVQQVMKIIAGTFAQELDKPSHSNFSARYLLNVVAANIKEKLGKPNYVSAQQLMKIVAASVKNHLDQPIYDYSSAQKLIRTIVTNIKEWPGQWEREKSLRGVEPRWKLRSESLKRIEALSEYPPDQFAADFVYGRIVICELLNSFPSIVFPNPLEMYSSIKYGIRPLLYSILRRQFINPRGFGFCANTTCRNFFNIERAGQQFCCSECSLHHRQRVYWQERGQKLRKKRSTQPRKKRK